MSIIRHPQFEKDVKKLKKYKTLQQSLDAFCKLLELRKITQEKIADTKGREVYKARVFLLNSGVGKSSGPRVVVEKCGESWALLYIFMHNQHGDQKHETNEIRRVISERTWDQ